MESKSTHDLSAALKPDNPFADVVFVATKSKKKLAEGGGDEIGGLDEHEEEEVVARGHRVILAEHSAFFKAMFTTAGMSEAMSTISPKNPVRIPILPALDKETFAIILRHIYGCPMADNLLFDVQQSVAVLEAVEYYQLDSSLSGAAIDEIRSTTMTQHQPASVQLDAILLLLSSMPLLQKVFSQGLNSAEFWGKVLSCHLAMTSILHRQQQRQKNLSVPDDRKSNSHHISTPPLLPEPPARVRSNIVTEPFECAGYRWRVICGWGEERANGGLSMFLEWFPVDKVKSYAEYPPRLDFSISIPAKDTSLSFGSALFCPLYPDTGWPKAFEHRSVPMQQQLLNNHGGLDLEVYINLPQQVARWSGQDMERSAELTAALCKLPLIEFRDLCFAVREIESAFGCSVIFDTVILPWARGRASWCTTHFDVIRFSQDQLAEAAEIPNTSTVTLAELVKAGRMGVPVGQIGGDIWIDDMDICATPHQDYWWDRATLESRRAFDGTRPPVKIAMRKTTLVQRNGENKKRVELNNDVYMMPNDWLEQDHPDSHHRSYNTIETLPVPLDQLDLAKSTVQIVANPIAEVCVSILASQCLNLWDVWSKSDHQKLMPDRLLSDVMGALLSREGVALESETQVLHLALDCGASLNKRALFAPLISCVRFKFIPALDVVQLLAKYDKVLHECELMPDIAEMWEKQAQDVRHSRRFKTWTPECVSSTIRKKVPDKEGEQPLPSWVTNDEEMTFRTLYGLAEAMQRNNIQVHGLDSHMVRYTEYLEQLERLKRSEEEKHKHKLEEEGKLQAAIQRLLDQAVEMQTISLVTLRLLKTDLEIECGREIVARHKDFIKKCCQERVAAMQEEEDVEPMADDHDYKQEKKKKAKISSDPPSKKKKRKASSSYIPDDVEPSSEDEAVIIKGERKNVAGRSADKGHAVKKRKQPAGESGHNQRYRSADSDSEWHPTSGSDSDDDDEKPARKKAKTARST